jgi:hypothetical protein
MDHLSGRSSGLPGLSYPRPATSTPGQDQATVEGCHAISQNDDFGVFTELLEQFGKLGCDVVAMVLADQKRWAGPLHRGAVAQHPPLAGRTSRRQTNRRGHGGAS